MILCDAGVLLCLVDRTQPHHNAYRRAVTRLAKPLVTTWPCLTEAMYLALHRGSWVMQKQLGQLLLEKLLTIYEIPESDYIHLFGLMEQYRDQPMDLVFHPHAIGSNRLTIPSPILRGDSKNRSLN